MTDSNCKLPPIFIGGNRRCGTTFLSDLLGQHPLISPIYETDFVLVLLEAFVDAKELPLKHRLEEFKQYAYKWSETLPHRPGGNTPNNKGEYETYSHGSNYFLLSTEEFRELTDEFIEKIIQQKDESLIPEYLKKLFARHCRKDEKPCWLNKTPRYIKYLKTLHDWFPNLIFIHALRDPRAVVASLKQFDWGPDSIEQCALRWIDNVNRANQFQVDHPDNFIEIRYESLVNYPVRCLRTVLKQLTTDKPERQLIKDMLKQVPAIDSTRKDKWKKNLSEKELETIREKVAPLLEVTGYSF